MDYTTEADAVRAHLYGEDDDDDLQTIAASTLTAITTGTSNRKSRDKSGIYAQLTMVEFVYRYRWPLLFCSTTWCCVNAVFVGLLLLIEPAAVYMGFNRGLTVQSAADECFGLTLAYLTGCLVTLVPGYYLAALSIDVLGRKTVQFLGFFFMAVWCAACAGSHDDLLTPNYTQNGASYGMQPGWTRAMVGWVVMFALVWLFAAFGPLTTCYAIPAEVFPTSWRATGYALCAAGGSVGSVLGTWGFLFASQPARYATTFAYPCTGVGERTSDYYKPCVEVNACPVGRRSVTGRLGDSCGECVSGMAKMGCYGFGVGVQGEWG